MDTDYLFLVTPTMGGKPIIYRRELIVLLTRADMLCGAGPRDGTINLSTAYAILSADGKIIAHIDGKPCYIERIEVRD